MSTASCMLRRVLFGLALSGPVFAQTAEVSYSVAESVPVLGSGMTLLLGIVLLLLGWSWLRKNPGSSYKNLAIGAISVGMLASAASGGWLVSNANAVIAATSYLFSENSSPVSVTSFPAMLENDLDKIATIESIEVSGCPDLAQVTGSCEEGLDLYPNGGSCSIDSVCSSTQQCETGVDPINDSPWVICEASDTEVWVSADNGGTYNADLICQNLGFDEVGQYGGTCGNVCGYCEAATSCAAPGNKTFDSSGNQGEGDYGLILATTVHWTCVNLP